MFRQSLLLIGAVYLHTLLAESTLDTDTQNHNTLHLSYDDDDDNLLYCYLQMNEGAPEIPNSDECTMTLRINGKVRQNYSVEGPRRIILSKYTAMLRVTASCSATCTSDRNIETVEIEIDYSSLFIWTCVGAVLGFIFLLGLFIYWVECYRA